MTKPIVHFRCVIGKELYDKENNLVSKVDFVKSRYDTEEYNNFIKSANRIGYNSVTIAKALNEDGSPVDPDKLAKIVSEFEAVKKPKAEALTPEQKRIKDLEDKLESLLSSSSPQKTSLPDVDDELKELRAEYLEKAKKKGSPRWDAETLREKIKEITL